jgi:hypothetical protein
MEDFVPFKQMFQDTTTKKLSALGNGLVNYFL